MQIDYAPDGEVLRAFFHSNKYFRGIRGPVGSGKSVACCIEIFRRATEQKPTPEGWRKSRWAVIRNTYPELTTTTIKTWRDWFDEGKWGANYKASVPFTWHLKDQDLMIDLEVIFLALDKDQDIKKLLSLELTGVYINEAREVPKSVIDAATSRVGRYPSMRDGGPSWYGIIADTNAPEDDHWWPIMSGDAPLPDYLPREEAAMLQKPPDWEFFNQPPALIEEFDDQGQVKSYRLNPIRENGQWTDKKYYLMQIQGKTKSWIDVYVMNRLGRIEDGKPVFSQYADEKHVAADTIPFIPSLPLYVGIDFGLTPSAIFGQRTATGRWVILKELIASDMGVQRFADLLKGELAKFRPDNEHNLFIYGDPAGDQRAQTDESTPFQILRNCGVIARPAPSNDVVLRIEAVETVLTRMVDGLPGFLLDPACTVLRKGFRGGYCYKKLQVSGGARYAEVPDKNKFSHPHDALQYMLIGAGEGKKIRYGNSNAKVTVADRRFNIWDRSGIRRQKRDSIWTRKGGA